MFDRFVNTPAKRRSRWKTFAIAGSIAVHVGIVVGLVGMAMWQLDKLAPDYTTSAFATASGAPAGDLGGAPPPPIKKQSADKHDKKVVKETVQPVRTFEVKIDYDENAANNDDQSDDKGHANGVLNGTGTDPLGLGTGTHGTGGRFDGFDDIDIDEPDAKEYQCDDGIDNDADGNADCADSDCDSAAACQQAAIVPQDYIEGLLISGNTQIHPPESVRVKMIHVGERKLTATVKMCLGTTGRVNSLSVLDSTDYAEYDAKLLREMRAWRYKPYTVNGQAVPVCTAITFIYKMVD